MKNESGTTSQAFTSRVQECPLNEKTKSSDFRNDRDPKSKCLQFAGLSGMPRARRFVPHHRRSEEREWCGEARPGPEARVAMKTHTSNSHSEAFTAIMLHSPNGKYTHFPITWKAQVPVWNSPTQAGPGMRFTQAQ